MASMLTLKQFLYSVPICSPPFTYQHLLTLFKSSQEDDDGVVLVNEKGVPLGIIFSSDFLLTLIEKPLISSSQNNTEVHTWEQSIPSVVPLDWETCISPLSIVSSDLSVWEFATCLNKKQQLGTKPPTYGLVDDQGKFLGLLNSWQILQRILAEDTNPQQELASATQLIKELLEELPLPVMLQTDQGETIQQNRTWREQVGELIPPENASSCPLPDETVGVPQNSTVGLSRKQERIFHHVGDNNSSQMTELACAQGLSSVSDYSDLPLSSVAGEMSLPSSHNHFGTQPPPISHQERVWQFIKCPLKTDKLPIPISIFVATDVTQQQQLCQELAAKNADLVQLNRLKDEFLACISHELKSPLTAVVGLSSLLQEQKIGDLNPRQFNYAQLIYRSGRQLMTLVNDLLDLTRLETGQLKLSFSPINIKGICERAYRSIEEKYKRRMDHPLSFNLEIEPGLKHLLADELRLHQMLVHLLDNAMKFTQNGGKVGLKVNRWEDWLAFTVWDTGIGIPEESQHLIFQKFQQLENPLTRQFEGTGLGLVLTQRLARAHGGEISFVSKVDQGSQFTLLLPPSPDNEQRSLHTQSCGPLILIVEAIPQSIEDLMDKLTQLGYCVIIARTGTEAVEKARQLRPYAIFLNPLLPLLSGWDVLTLLKSYPQTRNIPVFVTQTQGNQVSGEHHRANGFLRVPADLLTLQKILERGQPKIIHQSRPLTILRLNPNLSEEQEKTIALGSPLEWTSIAQLSQFNNRILEADDLEQAALLVTVWDVDVVLLDGQFLDNPESYLRSLAAEPELAVLPLIVLDITTAEAANKIGCLSVFPCLIADSKQASSELWQVISIAADHHHRS